MPTVRISVRNLVEFILNSGDLDNRHGGKKDADVLQEGAKLHRILQKRETGDYRAEVSLSISIPTEFDGERFTLVIEGRADGIYTAERPVDESDPYTDACLGNPALASLNERLTVIDEIKTMFTDPRRLEEPYLVHLAQAKVYAYIYAKNNGLFGAAPGTSTENTGAGTAAMNAVGGTFTEQGDAGTAAMNAAGGSFTEQGGAGTAVSAPVIAVRMTYAQIETEITKHIFSYYTEKELSEWFDSLVFAYAKWAAWDIRWKRERNISLKESTFPFEYRVGQKDLVANVYRSIVRNRLLFIEAPTGVGKTISTVFPSVKAMGEGKLEKIFYLTAKTITRTVAEEAFDTLMTRGAKMKVVTLTAKEKICILDAPDCNPESCPRAGGHFDRVNDAVFDMLENGGRISREEILKYAEKHNVCPFEMSLDLTNWSDAIICDYNYVYDPTVALKRFFADERKNDFVFLNDEAHNLVERGREMYSAELIKEDVLAVKRDVAGKKEEAADLMPSGSLRGTLVKKLEAVNKYMLSLKRECEEFEILDGIDELYYKLMRLVSAFDDFLDGDPFIENKDEVLNFYFNIRNFMSVYEDIGDDYTIYTDYTSKGDFRLKLMCMNPARLLKERLEKGKSAVFFSATLLPVTYYKDQLGGVPDDYAVYAPSPFDENNRLLLIGRDVSTKYTRRGESEYAKIAEYIRVFTGAKKGNYMVFFPSYKMLEDIGNIYLERNPEAEVIFQASHMTEREKEKFLDDFTYSPEKTRIAFCVMGGIFSEGIDLRSDRLIGAVIVGTGLPMVCNEKELFRGYYDRTSNSGFEYAYLYPGMNKVEQSAGRVIRTAQDRGAVLLLDERFVTQQYLRLFPREWTNYKVVNGPAGMERLLSEFWNKNDDV